MPTRRYVIYVFCASALRLSSCGMTWHKISNKEERRAVSSATPGRTSQFGRHSRVGGIFVRLYRLYVVTPWIPKYTDQQRNEGRFSYKWRQNLSRTVLVDSRISTSRVIWFIAHSQQITTRKRCCMYGCVSTYYLSKSLVPCYYLVFYCVYCVLLQLSWLLLVF